MARLKPMPLHLFADALRSLRTQKIGFVVHELALTNHSTQSESQIGISLIDRPNIFRQHENHRAGVGIVSAGEDAAAHQVNRSVVGELDFEER